MNCPSYSVGYKFLRIEAYVLIGPMRILDVLEQENHDRIELFAKTLKDSCQNLF